MVGLLAQVLPGPVTVEIALTARRLWEVSSMCTADKRDFEAMRRAMAEWWPSKPAPHARGLAFIGLDLV